MKFYGNSKLKGKKMMVVEMGMREKLVVENIIKYG
jgi:hypothetical protein